MQHTLARGAHEPDARPPYAEQMRAKLQTPDSPFGDMHAEPCHEPSVASRGNAA